jgi:hypothetical protein
MITYGGSNIFGAAVRLQHVARANAQQENTFFGVTGTQTLYGGGRGRTFLITGVLVGGTLATLNAAESMFEDFADGIARPLTDPRGRTWPNVIYKGEFVPDPKGPYPTLDGWALPYRAVFHGLT